MEATNLEFILPTAITNGSRKCCLGKAVPVTRAYTILYWL